MANIEHKEIAESISPKLIQFGREDFFGAKYKYPKIDTQVFHIAREGHPSQLMPDVIKLSEEFKWYGYMFIHGAYSNLMKMQDNYWDVDMIGDIRDWHIGGQILVWDDKSVKVVNGGLIKRMYDANKELRKHIEKELFGLTLDFSY